jgi:hypothetical protein
VVKSNGGRRVEENCSSGCTQQWVSRVALNHNIGVAE